MSKHTGPSKSGKATKKEKYQQELLEELKTLKPEWVAHIRASLSAVMPCSYCDATGKAAKTDELGLCLKCHGTKVLPNLDQRNWASQELGERLIPKKNATDITIDDMREQEAVEEELSKVGDDKLDAMLKEMGINVNDNPRN